MQSPKNYLAYFIFFTAYIILIGSSFFTILELKKRNIASYSLTHTYTVTNVIQSTLLSFTDAERHMRFYLDTHNKKFLNLYQLDIINTEKDLSKIKKLISDNALQNIRVKSLEVEIKKSNQFVQNILANSNAINLTYYLTKNEQLMANIKGKINELIAVEN